MLKEYIFEQLLDAAINKAKKILKESDSKFVRTREEIEESIRQHLQAIENWSSEVSFRELNKAKHITGIYIELDLYVRPRRASQPNENIEHIPLRNIFEYSANHPILLGQPGAGKTTSMKYLCQLLLHDDSFYSNRFAFPVLIKFRELRRASIDDETVIIDQIFNILGLQFGLPEGIAKEEVPNLIRRIKEKLVISALEEFKILLILEGLDELGNNKLIEQIIEEIRKLATNLSYSTMIITSRSGDFVYSIDNTIQYEISSLSDTQITQFATKWLEDTHLASEFLKTIRNSPFSDTTIRPLTLAYLCAIYERMHKIPDKPRSIYKRVINLLLEEWDQQRSVTRASRYANFEVDRKFDFLCRLSFVLTTTLTATVFSENDLKAAYLQIFQYYDLVRQEAQQVVNELETHTGLFIESGYRQYEFAHKSIQEYLAAEFIVKLPSIPSDLQTLLKLPNELAIAVSISSSSSDYFSELVLNVFNGLELSNEFLRSFISRLLLEKPDFHTTFNISLALVVLYSAYMESMINRDKESRSIYRDSVTTEFEQFIEAILKKNTSLALMGLYDIQQTFKLNNGKLHLLSRKAGLDHGLAARLVHYPKNLYVRDSFL